MGFLEWREGEGYEEVEKKPKEVFERLETELRW